jgi:hypothetical protein
VNKKQSLRVHAKKRAKERYGLDLNRTQLQEIIGKCRNGSAKLLRHHSLRVREFLVAWQGLELRVLYDKLRKEIITFLPGGKPSDQAP